MLTDALLGVLTNGVRTGLYRVGCDLWLHRA